MSQAHRIHESAMRREGELYDKIERLEKLLRTAGAHDQELKGRII